MPKPNAYAITSRDTTHDVTLFIDTSGRPQDDRFCYAIVGWFAPSDDANPLLELDEARNAIVKAIDEAGLLTHATLCDGETSAYADVTLALPSPRRIRIGVHLHGRSSVTAEVI